MLDLDDFRFCVFEQLALEFSEGGMHLPLVCAEMQNAAHLRFRVAARSGAGHAQTSRNAERGEEKVARPAFEMRVKIKRKGGVTLDQRFDRNRRIAELRAEAKKRIWIHEMYETKPEPGLANLN